MSRRDCYKKLPEEQMRPERPEGELVDLEGHWREVEEIAVQTDRLLLPEDTDERLATLKVATERRLRARRRGERQPRDCRSCDVRRETRIGHMLHH